MRTLLVASLMLPVLGCAPKVLILQDPVVSMTKRDTGGVKSLKEGKSVEEKWCSDDDPIHKNDDGSKHYGMIDQVVWKAHKATSADFFINNRFYQQGGCVYMSANVGELAGGGSGPSSGGAEESVKPAPAKKAPKKAGKKK